MKIKKKKGAALIFVMIAMLIMFMMISVVVNITQANTNQASNQEKKLQAYYIARSGAELAYEVLLTTTPSLLDNFKSDLNLVLEEKDIAFTDGTADIKVTTEGVSDDQIIRIESTGRLKEDTDITRVVFLEFYVNYDDNPDITWSR